MGVIGLARWCHNMGETGISQLHAVIGEKLQAENKGQWTMNFKVYLKQIVKSEKEQVYPLYQITSSIHPDKSFFWCKDNIIEGENSLPAIILMMKNLWKERNVAKIIGHSYQSGDFIIRFGNLYVGTSFEGVIVEIEYLPTNRIATCSSMIKEMVYNIFPSDANLSFHLDADYSSVNLSPRTFTLSHFAFQYKEMFRLEHLL